MHHLRKLFRYGAVPVAVLAVLAIATVIWLRASTGLTIHGEVLPPPANTGVLGAAAVSYAGCEQVNPRPGTLVTVTDPSGKVIGTGTLGTWSHATTRVAGIPAYTCRMPFTVNSVPHETSYGFQIPDVPGTIWVTNVSKPVSLNLGG